MSRNPDLLYTANDVIDAKYRVIRHVGSGGMGVVYEVEDVTVEKHYVLKVLRPEYGSNKSIVQRMVQEAKALGKLHHRNIVEIFTAGGADKTYLALAKGRFQNARGTAACLPFGRLVRFPGFVLGGYRGDLGVTEYMRMPPLHLVGDRLGDVIEREQPGLLGHAGVKHDLKQEIAEFVL